MFSFAVHSHQIKAFIGKAGWEYDYKAERFY